MEVLPESPPGFELLLINPHLFNPFVECESKRRYNFVAIQNIYTGN